jgi:hypothetical protein
MDHYFFWGGDGEFLTKIVCKDKKVQINCLQANEIIQHQPRFKDNEQSAHWHTQGFNPKSPEMGDTGDMSQSTYGL